VRRPVALALAGVGVAAAAAGTWALFSALDAQGQPAMSQARAESLNETIADRNTLARVMYGVSGAALATAAVAWFWPRLTASKDAPPQVAVMPASGGGVVSWTGGF
jgi:hypothetical protein